MPPIRARLAQHEPRATADRLWLARCPRGGASAVRRKAATPGKRAAVATVLREGKEGPRGPADPAGRAPPGPWSGHMALPGGRESPDDPDLLATAIRKPARSWAST